MGDIYSAYIPKKLADENPLSDQRQKTTQVKIIKNYSLEGLEFNINQWIFENRVKKYVKDIKFSSQEDIAFIIYEEWI